MPRSGSTRRSRNMQIAALGAIVWLRPYCQRHARIISAAFGQTRQTAGSTSHISSSPLYTTKSRGPTPDRRAVALRTPPIWRNVDSQSMAQSVSSM